jgi:3-oxoacyl-(acyl-carrier-protein) synthase/3-hydroxymyristoyl/3-hydroxydecanoyl-(acyl carrier protein) dehydratase
LARTDRVYSRRGYFVEEIPLRIEEFDLPRGLLAEMDPVFHLALEAGRQAFAAAATRQLDRRRIGVILGNIALPTEAASTLARGLLGRTFEEKLLGQAPAAFAVPPACGTALPAGLLARALGLGGGSCTLDAACASSLYALKLAAEELRAGRADAMLAGGVSRPDCLYTQMGFSQLRALSPTGCCRPFDAGADGLVVGEGTGVFLLKRLEDARRDGDLVLAVLAGIGLSNDVGGSLLAPSSEGQLRAMDDAYREAGWVPADVDLIECHATGTPLGDAVEFRSLRALWGEHGWKPGQCVIGSVKSTVGHLLTAAGAAALVKVLSAFGAETLPPTANFRAPAPGLDYEGSPFRVLNESRYWPRRRPDVPRRAAISGFGFGGINAHVLLEEAPVVATGGSPVVFLPPDRKASCPSLRSERQAGRLAVRNVPVAVVGMEACFGPWRSLQAFQERVLGGGDPAKPQPPRHWWGIPESNWFQAAGPRGLLFAGFYLDGPIAVAVDRFRIPPRELRDMLPQQLLMLQVAAGALACAPVRPDCRARAGVYLGMGIDFNTTNFHFRWWVLKNARAWAERKGGHRDAAEVEEWVRALADAAGPPLTADRTMGALASIAASRIARELHLGGSSFTLCGEENSGLRALEAAVRALQRSEIDQALAGAVDLAGDVRAVLGRRFFDPAAEGGVIGEGAAAVVLKRLPDAVADGDTIHAVIKGIGTASGGEGDFPDEAACREALARACREAEMDLDSAASLHPESARADVGDAGAASGLASFVKACLGLARKTTAAEPRHASVRSCGRDGTCTLVILEGGEEGPVGRDSDPDRACQDGIPNARGPTVEVPIGGRPFVLPYTPWDQENRDTVAPQIAQAAATAGATGLAHAAYLRLAQALHRGITSSLSFQTTLLEAFLASGGRQPPVGLQVKKQGADAPRSPVRFDRRQCLEFAAGSIGRVLGPAFAAIDAHPTRVRLPDEPLMLVDRILTVEGEPLSLASGRVVTEHDVLPGAWYLDGNRVPTCIAVEAGQADLFLSAYLGIDLRTRGRAVYRLLDAAVTFHRGLPGPGAIIHYDIHIDRFFRQGDTHLFRFRFEGTVGGEPLLTMTDGCAGFFTPAELSAGKGVVQTALNRQPRPGRRAEGEEDLAPPAVESYADEQIDALRAGDLAAAFGPPFRGLTLTESLRLPGGRMRLVHRVVHLDPQGGRFGIGLIRAEADIHLDDWFLTCHFVDDQVMPGTLMYECCLHTLRIFLLRLGWVATRGEPDHFGSRCAGGSATGAEPVPGVAGRLRCRGQVTPATRTVTCEVTCKERGYGPAPYALADALICADGKPIVEITDMSLRLSGLDREQVTTLWQRQGQRGARTQHVIAGPARVPCFRGPSGSWEGPPSGLGRESVPPPTEPLVPETCTNLSPPCAFPKERILAFAVGKPSEAFGEPYRVFDAERVIARLPGPPFGFLDRIVRIEAEPWKMVAGGVALAEYDVPPDAWYFTDERQPAMPFAVLLEVALQPCGWLAAYVGSALTSPEDLSFRNLGGEAVLHAPVGPDVGTLSTRVRLASVASSGGTILQHYDFEVRSSREIIYGGKTSFGFFPRAALAHQVGIQGTRPYEPSAAERARGRAFPFPRRAPLPGGCLRMVDRIDLYVPDGGPRGLGLIEGSKDVDPDEWFFQAHFYQDPVWPGSLGLESFVQLLKVAALQRWPAATRLQVAGGSAHRWLYRGQVVPGDRRVAVQAVVTACEETEAGGHLTADGWLLVDGRAIYRMNDFTLSAGRAR